MNTDVYELRYWVERAAEANDPFGLIEYLKEGLPASSAPAWCEAAIPPQMARDFEALGLGPEEAERWGVIPVVVREFLEMGFDADWTRAWRNAVGFTAIEAAAWRDAGLSIADAQVMCNADRVGTAVMLQFALAGMRPTEAISSILTAAPDAPQAE